VHTSRRFREFFAMLSWNFTPLQGKKLPKAATYGSIQYQKGQTGAQASHFL